MNHEIKITRSYSYTDQDIEDIVVTALEGGIGYWACLDNTGAEWEAEPKDTPTSVWAYKLLMNGHTLKFEDEEDNEATYELSLANLYDGIGKAIKSGDWDGDIDTIDGMVADVIFQYGIFGDIVYG